MKSPIPFVFADLRLVFRDRMLSLFFFAPLLLILFTRFLVPYITILYPLVEDYHPYVMMFAGMQTAIIFGFITAFMILEEKDENVIEAIRVLPISSELFIGYRLLFGTLFSFVGAFLVLTFGGLAYPGLVNSVLLSFQYSLVAPFIALSVGTFAHNKIEGMAWFKGVNLLLILPILHFFLSGLIQYIFAPIPVFWTYLLYKTALEGINLAFTFLIGLLVHLLVLTVLFHQFKKKVFEK